MFNISVSKDQEPGKLCSVLLKFLKNLKCLKICVEQNLTANQYDVTCFDEQGLNYVTTSSHIFQKRSSGIFQILMRQYFMNQFLTIQTFSVRRISKVFMCFITRWEFNHVHPLSLYCPYFTSFFSCLGWTWSGGGIWETRFSTCLTIKLSNSSHS